MFVFAGALTVRVAGAMAAHMRKILPPPVYVPLRPLTNGKRRCAATSPGPV